VKAWGGGVVVAEAVRRRRWLFFDGTFEVIHRRRTPSRTPWLQKGKLQEEALSGM
jgi:hypothetical protein